MWNDKDTDVDLLGHVSLARTIAGLIRDHSLTPLTIGVYGSWGAGKSSILRMIEMELSAEEETACLTFNGWLFQGFEDTKSVLMETIIGELQRLQPMNQVLKTKAREILNRVDWLKVARRTAGLAWMGMTGMPDPYLLSGLIEKIKAVADDPTTALKSDEAKSFIESLKGSIKESDGRTIPEEIYAFRKDFEELLKTAKIQRLVVLVDDLDRCLPETAIETLEAIRLFFYVPGTVFVLAADEEMVAYAVRRHFPDLPVAVGQSDYTRNYLEKLIQVPFRVPPLGKTETRTYITLLLAERALRAKPELATRIRDEAKVMFSRPWEGKKLDEDAIRSVLGSVPDELKSPLLLADRISGALAEGLEGNPRQIKRFLNTLTVRLLVAEAQAIAGLVNEDALAKLMLLERFNGSVYKEILELMAQSEEGRVPSLKALEQFARSEKQSLAKGKAKKSEPDIPEGWQSNEWLLAWARIDPLLGEIDLRPYFYISREKSPGFATEMALSAGLDQLAEKLSSGEPIIISGLKNDLKVLGVEEARKLFGHLVDKARLSPDWKTKPRQMEGLYTLCKEHPELQDDLVTTLENIPVAELGAWAVTGMKPVLTNSSSQQRFQNLLAKWALQQESPSLRKAVEQLGSL
jgi:predicted KAP-like P-loop ATPase